MPKRTSPAKSAASTRTDLRVTIVTLDSHLANATERAARQLTKELPGLTLTLHSLAEWGNDIGAKDRCLEDIAKADIILASMLFMEEHIQAVLPALQARRDHCDAMVACMSAGEVIKLTRLGDLNMDGSKSGVLSLIKRLKGSSKKSNHSNGAKQMAMLRRLPKILRFIPGAAQDLRAYFLTMQYWMAGSDQDVANLVRLLVNRYATGPRKALRGALDVESPTDYPDVGLYHPRMKERVAASLSGLPRARKHQDKGTVGLLLMRSYVMANNTAHYDGVIEALEAKGLKVVPAFAGGLDARPAVEAFFLRQGQPTVDAVVSLTGFSLVGGPAYNNAEAAQEMLAQLDVPYIAAQAVEFQTLEQWEDSDLGLTPIEATMMVAIPEIDGSTGPMVFGGRSENGSGEQARDMHAHNERAAMLAARVAKLVALRKTPAAERKVAITIFNFPPNAGAVGTAAFLSVFRSLHNTLTAMKAEGYDLEVPRTVEDLRRDILDGNAGRFGADANVLDMIPVDDHVRREPFLREIEDEWGAAPGKHLTDGRNLFILGASFGKVVVAVQPPFGYEGDPMRLLFERGLAPTHAFSAFYRYLREDFVADAVLHFGTHGALEFMPGKQVALSSKCWPDRMIGDLPNLYLYAGNNPSEGTIAKRRAAATLISYMSPPVTEAGLYKDLLALKGSIDAWRALPPDAASDRLSLAPVIQTQAQELDMIAEEKDAPVWDASLQTEKKIEHLRAAVLELEHTLIPFDLHVLGEAPSRDQRVEMLLAMAESEDGLRPPREVVEGLVDGKSLEDASRVAGPKLSEAMTAKLTSLSQTAQHLAGHEEIPAVLRALDGRFIRPAPGGDLLHTPEALPTGRNIHAFDPFKLPSAHAVAQGLRQADQLILRHIADGNSLPEQIALVLWGTDNLKTEGTPIGLALALVGAKPRFDSYGRLVGASLIPLEELGRPRIDVVITLSGIFRDLLPLQTRLLAEAFYLAAIADEPAERNFVRAHTLKYQAEQDCDFDTAALRVFSNDHGAYGSNVNLMVDGGAWNDEDELAETFMTRKCFAYGKGGRPVSQQWLMKAMLADVQLAYQNLESVELGVTTLDHYFDTLGGISRSVERARGEAPKVYIGDHTRGDGKVRTLSEQVALETRTRALNPKWFESMLNHGHEGVRQIEAHVTNTMGWSATTGSVDPWVYQQLTSTFVLDEEMRQRLAALNPTASARMANRLLEACERDYWTPDDDILAKLREAGEELEDRVEGIGKEAAE